MIDEKRTMLLHRIHGNRGVARTASEAAKRLGVDGVGLGSDELAVGGQTPKVGATGMKIGARKGAKRTDERAGGGVLKGGVGELQKKFLERLFRLRRVAGTRISGVGSQCAPIA